jgi:drug/metabolite transporter (DMT)-like permease
MSFGILAAFAAIYLIWGTTYLGIAIAIETLPPFVSGALRFLAASALLYGWLRLRRPAALKGVRWLPAMGCGVLLTGMGNGFVVWAQQGVPSGIAALVVASIPIFILAFDWTFFSRQAPGAAALAGLGIATIGVVTIVMLTHSLTGGVNTWYLVSLLVAVVAWSFATLLQKKLIGSASAFGFTAAQMLGGGLFQLAMATFTGEWSHFHPANVSAASLLAVGYLVLFGSIVALSCYSWLLTRVSPQKVTTYSLVNPVVAVILGAAVLNEAVNVGEVIAGLAVLAGVSLVLFRNFRWPFARRSALTTE